MSLTQQLPQWMCCLLCFSPEALERRTDKKGRPYYSCGLCHFRLFLHNETQAYGVLFWARALADGALVQAARADLERALGSRGKSPAGPLAQPAHPPVTNLETQPVGQPSESHRPPPGPLNPTVELPAREASATQGGL